MYVWRLVRSDSMDRGVDLGVYPDHEAAIAEADRIIGSESSPGEWERLGTAETLRWRRVVDGVNGRVRYEVIRVPAR